MLTVNYSDDEVFLSGLYSQLGIENSNLSGINAVLYEGADAIGVANLHMVGRRISLDFLKVFDENAKEIGIVDFFFRTILYKLSMSDVSVFIKTNDARLLPFGFKPVDGGMEVEADDIEFPSSCGGHKK